MSSGADILKKVAALQLRTDLPNFKVGDTVRVHGKIVEGTKERIQVFEGVVIKRSRGTSSAATFTVRKVSYNIGVERTFFLHSPRIEKIEIVSSGKVRRSKLYYLRGLRGKKARIEELHVYETAAAKSGGAKSGGESGSGADPSTTDGKQNGSQKKGDGGAEASA